MRPIKRLLIVRIRSRTRILFIVAATYSLAWNFSRMLTWLNVQYFRAISHIEISCLEIYITDCSNAVDVWEDWRLTIRVKISYAPTTPNPIMQRSNVEVESSNETQQLANPHSNCLDGWMLSSTEGFQTGTILKLNQQSQGHVRLYTASVLVSNQHCPIKASV